MSHWLKVQVRRHEMETEKVVRQIEKKVQKGLKKVGSRVYKTARQSIRRTQKSAPPGTPPRTHTGALKRAIRVAETPSSVFIGPAQSVMGAIGQTHEFGGTERKKLSKLNKRMCNWRPVIGGHGPIKKGGAKGVYFIKIETPQQAARSLEFSYKALLALGVSRGKAKSMANTLKNNPAREDRDRTAHYPARPFMGPALEKNMSYLTLLTDF